MEEFPNNSIDPKIQRPIPTQENQAGFSGQTQGKKDIKKIVIEGAIKRKKTRLERIADAFKTEGKTFGQTLIHDVLLPGIRDTLWDAVLQTGERAFFGEVRSTTRRTAHRGPVGNASNISYNRYSASNGFRDRPEPSRIVDRARGGHHFDEIELQTRAEGQAILREMDAAIKRYHHVSVADLYEMVSIEAEFTDERWGWTDLYGADVRRLRSGNYALVLPPTEAIG